MLPCVINSVRVVNEKEWERRAPKARQSRRERVRSKEGVTPFLLGEGSEEGAVLPPQKIV